MSGFTLRPYQAKLVKRVRRTLGSCRRVVLQSPTGSGKTVLTAHMIRRAALRGRSSWFVVHRRELLDQTSDALWASGVEHGVIAGGRTSSVDPVQVATIQTLVRRLDQLPPPDFLIIDEAHHTAATSYRNVVEHCPDTYIVGLTATPCRTDGRGLADLFDALVPGPSVAWLTDEGYLAPYKVVAPPSAVDLTGVRTRAGDYARGELEAAVDQQAIVGDAVDHYRKYVLARSNGRPPSCLVYCVSRAHARHVEEAYRAQGVDARYCAGDTPTDERNRIVSGFQHADPPVIVSVDLFGEGLDVPGLQAVQLLRPTQSLGLHLQQCLDSETEILTPEGWAGPHDIDSVDECAAYDPATGEVLWVPIENRVARPLAEGENMYAISGPHLDIRVTGGHAMLAKGLSRTCARWQRQSAEEMGSRRAMYKIPVAGDQAGPGVPLSEAELRFVGWVLADGTVNRASRQVVISQSAGKVEHCERIRSVLRGCGFKFGEHRVERKGAASQYDDSIRFSVSFGEPRGRDKHLRGCGELLPWLDPSLPEHLYEALSGDQIRTLLDALWYGDGNNGHDPSWTRRTRTITTGDDERLADRLQSLCVRRGLRCNKAYSTPPADASWGATRRQWFLHIRDSSHATIAGCGVPDGKVEGKPYRRSRFEVTDSQEGEPVWCVQNRLGTLIVRRNGKVAIVGNCGRSLRPEPGKTAMILDHVGNTWKHGLPDDERDWSLEGTRQRRDGTDDTGPDLRGCAECFMVFRAQLGACPGCGWRPETKEQELPEEVEGELEEVDPEEHRRRRRLEEARARGIEALVALAKQRGYKPGWAAHRHAARTGIPVQKAKALEFKIRRSMN